MMNKNETIFNNTKTIEQLKNQIAELQQIKFDENKIKQLEQSIYINKVEKDKLNKKNLDISSRINSLLLKAEDNKKIEKKILGIEICPTCLQNVDAVYKANVLNKIHTDDVEGNKQLQVLTAEKREIEAKLNWIEMEISSGERQLTDLKILKMKLQDIREKEKQIEGIEKTNILFEKDIQLLKQHIDLLTNSILSLISRFFHSSVSSSRTAMPRIRFSIQSSE